MADTRLLVEEIAKALVDSPGDVAVTEKAGEQSSLLVTMKSDKDVIQHACVGKQADVLKRPCDAKSGDTVRVAPRYVDAAYQKVPIGRSGHSRNQVDNRALARAVRPDQPGYSTRWN